MRNLAEISDIPPAKRTPEEHAAYIKSRPELLVTQRASYEFEMDLCNGIITMLNLGCPKHVILSTLKGLAMATIEGRNTVAEIRRRVVESLQALNK